VRVRVFVKNYVNEFAEERGVVGYYLAAIATNNREFT